MKYDFGEGMLSVYDMKNGKTDIFPVQDWAYFSLPLPGSR